MRGHASLQGWMALGRHWLDVASVVLEPALVRVAQDNLELFGASLAAHLVRHVNCVECQGGGVVWRASSSLRRRWTHPTDGGWEVCPTSPSLRPPVTISSLLASLLTVVPALGDEGGAMSTSRRQSVLTGVSNWSAAEWHAALSWTPAVPSPACLQALLDEVGVHARRT